LKVKKKGDCYQHEPVSAVALVLACRILMSNALKDRNVWHISIFSEQLVSAASSGAVFIILPDFLRIAADLHAYASFA